MNRSIENDLEALLSEDIASVKERENNSFDKWEEKINTHGLLLFGCGNFGKRTLSGLQKSGIEPLGFVDNNKSLWSKAVNGILVYSPKEAVQKFPNALYMVTIWNDTLGHPLDEIERILHAYNKNVTVISFVSLFWKYPKLFLPYFCFDSPHKTIEQANLISQAYSLWADEVSRKEYLAQINWRLKSDFKVLPGPVKYQQYFPDDIFSLTSDEVFIDIGAFDGDTLRDFMKIQSESFDKYFAFEPDPNNFLKLKDQVMRLPNQVQKKIIIKQLAVGSEKKQIAFNANGTIQSSYEENGDTIVDCIPLDEELFDYKPTYIKMDTEGFEADIIKGASKIIEKVSPILAIAIYHQYDHIWQLPLAIQKLSKNYQFYLRPHRQACWELVCYAVPKARVNRIGG